MFQIKVRVVLGLLVFSMFFLYQMCRFNISLAIVAIANDESTLNATAPTWDTKPMLLGAFFWMSWITELSGAYLVGKFGCRNVLTVAYLLNGVCSLIFPLAYHIHPLCAVVTRIIQGVALGVTWPAVGWISARWIPKEERSRFLSAFHGSSLGGSVSNLVGGVIIHAYGWSYIFYISGILCLLWVLLFRANVYDLPSLHPRISAEEREYLEKFVEADVSSKKKVSHSAPWLNIFMSVPFWAVFLVFFSMMWFNVTLALQLPTYLNMVHTLNIRTNGYLLSIPDIGKMCVGLTFPIFVDNLIQKKKISISTARKLSNTIGMAIPGTLLILLGFYGYTSVELATVLIVLTISISGAGSSSIIASVIDLSPNHSGSLMGFLKTMCNIPGILSPLMVRYMLGSDMANWLSVFVITSIIVLVSSIFFLFFSSSNIQPWNKVNHEELKSPENNEELLMVKTNTSDKEQSADSGQRVPE